MKPFPLFVRSCPWIWLTVFVGCAPAGLEQSCSNRRAPIVGGQELTELPAVGALTFDSEVFCSGTLITSSVVLTAAHCLDLLAFMPLAEAPLRFVVGSSVKTPTEILSPRAIALHPDYRREDKERHHDLALLYLAAPAAAEPLDLTERLGEDVVGTVLLFVGYGSTSGAAPIGVGIKRAAEVTIEELTEDALVILDADHSTCLGDSGGPALVRVDGDRPRVAAVTSQGNRRCANFARSTRVDTHSDFLSGLPRE